MISLPGIALSAIAGILPLLWLPSIPELPSIVTLLASGLFLIALNKPYLRYPALVLLFLCWGLLAARESLAPFQQWTQKPVTADVVITRSDGAQKHELQLIKASGQYLFPPIGVSLRGTYLPEPACAGQKWQMTLRLQSVHGQLNEGGFDSQKYALAQHMPLRGRLIEAKRLNGECSLRARWLNRVSEATHGLEFRGIILALAFGERADMTSQIKYTLRQTGTAHLMAISGMHISLAAGVGWLIARLLQGIFPANRINYRMPLIASLLTAGIYTWLAGANPPAVRAFLGLTIWLLLRLHARRWSSWEVWAGCVAGILLCDPLTVLSASFWLSVTAVASLIFWYQWMPLPLTVAKYRWYIRYPLNLLHLQIGITLLLMPMQVSIFHGISITALVANLLAVPFVSFIIIPLLIVGLVVTSIPWLGESLWRLVDSLLAMLFEIMNRLPDGWLEVDYRFQILSVSGWLAVIIYRTSFWRTSPFAVFVLGSLLLSASIKGERSEPGSWQITMLDVGHGLAIAIIRDGKAYLYDTGNAWPGGDAGLQTIIPWLRWHNLTPEEVLISHEHLDHRGGLNSLLQTWPALRVRSPLRWANHHPCFQGEKWQWQGLTFQAYWPPAENTPTGNNRSCVVKVSDGHFSMLLTGDVETPGEKSMLKGNLQNLKADVIQVPHHGSRTSSGNPLLRVVSGSAALASVSRYNAWQLPSIKVIERYKNQDYKWHDTSRSGQITIHINRDKWQIIGFREQILRRWYHQWFGVDKYKR